VLKDGYAKLNNSVTFFNFCKRFNISAERPFSVLLLIQKVSNLSNRGSSSISSPLAFAEGLFVLKYFFKKEGFFKSFVVLILWCRKIKKTNSFNR